PSVSDMEETNRARLRPQYPQTLLARSSEHRRESRILSRLCSGVDGERRLKRELRILQVVGQKYCLIGIGERVPPDELIQVESEQFPYKTAEPNATDFMDRCEFMRGKSVQLRIANGLTAKTITPQAGLSRIKLTIALELTLGGTIRAS